jgi:hypothetical protein
MASYLGNNPDNIIRVRKGNYRYVATSSQTAFSGTDSNSLTMAINLSDVEVFLNGVLLDQTDYTATASTITLSSGATLNDIVEVMTTTDFQVASLYTKEEVDAKVSVAITNLKGGASTALDTLNELATALGNDANYAATITTALGTKANTTTVNSALALKVGIDSATGAATIPVGTTVQRPANPSVGMLRYNTDLGYIEEYRSNMWLAISNVFVAEGGTVTVSNGYKYHTFTSSNTFSVLSGSNTIEYLMVAGGGGAGEGGGGAGGYIAETALLSVKSFAVVVGAGGADAAYGAAASNGANSTFNGVTAIGGGRGATISGINALSGGSGGGGRRDGATAGAAGTTGQGFAGGTSPTGSYQGAAGGGGASQTGRPGGGGTGPSEFGGAGGAGKQWLNGSYYAGGGAGGVEGGSSTGPALGGVGGGGNGNVGNSTPTAGTTNTGGGGGGAGGPPNAPPPGKAGGSGIVIIRYAV